MAPAHSPGMSNTTKNGAVLTSVWYELSGIFGWMMMAWAGDRRLEKRKQLVSSVESTAHVWCNFDMLKKSRLCRADTVNDLFRKSEGFCSFFAQKSEGFCSFCLFAVAQPCPLDPVDRPYTHYARFKYCTHNSRAPGGWIFKKKLNSRIGKMETWSDWSSELGVF